MKKKEEWMVCAAVSFTPYVISEEEERGLIRFVTDLS